MLLPLILFLPPHLHYNTLLPVRVLVCDHLAKF